MTERKEHYDEDSDLGLSPNFSEDLNTLFKLHLSVPPEVDRAIMDRANRHFVHRHWRHRLFRRPSLWRIAAAAAVIILAFSLTLNQKSGTTTPSSFVVEPQAIDIDRNGRVDILDAFKLARHVESKSTSRTETNLSLLKQGWDINGDGLVNRNDVDLVASAAVRLDKGVL